MAPVLHAQFARDSERVARFRREAQLLASLNHASIAAIYGIEELIRRRLELETNSVVCRHRVRDPVHWPPRLNA